MVHRDLIDLNNDGVHARCTFYYVYEGHHGKRQHIPLVSRNMQIRVSPTRLPETMTTILKANEVPDVQTTEVFWPTLDPEVDATQRGQATPESARAYAEQNQVLQRWTGDDALQVISVHENLLNEIKRARHEFITERVEKLRKAKGGNWLDRMSLSQRVRQRPGAVGNYYIRFRFSNDPIFVLRQHPDRDVRMTAWLTVLTSLFALAMELFPLRSPDPAHSAQTRIEQGSGSRPMRIP